MRMLKNIFVINSRFLSRLQVIWLFLLVAIAPVACNSKSFNSRSVPVEDTLSVSETSMSRPALANKIDFIERYLSFERGYEALEYRWFHSDNSGGLVPGPSDWNYQLLAIVPPDEIALWKIEGVVPVDTSPLGWVDDIPGDIPTDGITEWYFSGKKMVGIDRDRAIVAYWLSSEIISATE